MGWDKGQYIAPAHLPTNLSKILIVYRINVLPTLTNHRLICQSNELPNWKGQELLDDLREQAADKNVCWTQR